VSSQGRDLAAEQPVGMLDPQDVEAIAAALAPRVIAFMQLEPFPARGLLKAERVAELLKVNVSWVYEHKTLLGAVRLGEGRGALRFEASKVLAYLHDHRVDADAGPARVRPGPRRRRGRDDVELLPLPDDLR
jgi:hypothetical protein